MLKSLRFTLYCLILMLNTVYASPKQVNILSIHSYHQEYPWTASQYEAFKEQIEKKLPEYSFNFAGEYLDTKRIAPSKQYKKNFLKFIHSKYGDRLPDLIYITDDNALNFIHSDESQISWKNVPIIFSGINNSKISQQHAMHPVEGVFEFKDIHSAIKLAKSITQASSEIIFLGDGGTTDKAIKSIIEQGEYIKNGHKISHTSFSKLNNLINKVNKTADSTIILTTIGRIRDDKNNLLKLQETIKAITDTGKKILVMEDAYLFPGVLGGYVTSGRSQGENAANIASNIIKGKTINHNNPANSTEFVLSWPEAKRFDINIKAHPFNEARLINTPTPLNEKYPQIIKWLFWFAISLIFIIVGFVFYTRQKNIQLKEQYTDSVTRLPNRVKLMRDINKSKRPYLIIVDINNFKLINNLYGLKEADNLLINFGKQVSKHIDKSQNIYRITGDQFAILSENNKYRHDHAKYIKALLNDMQNNNYHIGDIDINLTLTAGVSINEHEFLIPHLKKY